MSFIAVLTNIALLGVAIFFLVQGTSLMIRSLNRISRSTNVELFVLTGFFSAVATSMPELFVSVSSALSGNQNMALGVVLGSNIANVTFVAGTVAILGGGISVVGDFVKRDVLKAFGVVVFPLIWLIDGGLSRLDGVLLILAFLVYHITVFQNKHKYHHHLKSKPFVNIGKWIHSFDAGYQKMQIGWFVVGLMLLLFASDVIVQVGTDLATELGIPVLIVGLFFVALGTSLPEVAFEIKAIRNKQFGVVLGDLLGSLVANSTLILGVTSLISPITVFSSEMTYFNSAMVFLLGFFLLWSFMKSKLRVSPLEGAVLIGVYFLFLVLEVGVI